MDSCFFGKNYKHYIYQDLSYPYLYKLKITKNEGYNYSGFQMKKSSLKYLSIKQNDYYKKCSGIFTMSKNLYNDLYEDTTLRHKIMHVGSGANSINKPIINSNKELSFVFIGKNFIRKSGDLVCEAYTKIKNKLPNETKLYIIGPSSIDNNYITNGIVFLGEQPYSICAEMLKKCKVFVMPSRFEAYGLVFPEALINGCICIGNNAFEMKEFINDDNGFLVNINQNKDLAIDQLSNVMLKAINSNLLVDGNKYYDLYNWDLVASRMVDFILKDL